MSMSDWCPNGCQDLCGLGECGMCGYVGDGVDYFDTDYIIDFSEETGRYERMPNPEKFHQADLEPEVEPVRVGRLVESFVAGMIAGFLGA